MAIYHPVQKLFSNVYTKECHDSNLVGFTIPHIVVCHLKVFTYHIYCIYEEMCNYIYIYIIILISILHIYDMISYIYIYNIII